MVYSVGVVIILVQHQVRSIFVELQHVWRNDVAQIGQHMDGFGELLVDEVCLCRNDSDSYPF